MEFPEKIPIKRLEDYHTHHIGRYGNSNQFWGYETFIYTRKAISTDEDWKKYRREYVVLYLFDAIGEFVTAKSWFGGTTDNVSIEEMQSKLETMISELGAIEYCDIEIQPFQTEIDGFLFGLIPDHESEMMVLQPNSTISFSAPWDGEYYT